MRIGLVTGAFSGDYCLSILRYVSQEIALHNASLIVIEGYGLKNSTPDNIACNAVFRLITQERLDGLIVLPGTMFFNNSKEIAEALASKVNIPVVAMGLPLEGIPSVVPDSDSGFEELISHLYSHGMKKLAFIGGTLSNPVTLSRRESFLNVVKRIGLELPDHLIIEGTYGYMSGYNYARKLVPHIRNGLVQAVVCANDEIAHSAIRCFHEHGINVPKEVAVTGFDDFAVSDCCSPSITTLNQRLEDQAKKAVAMLFELILGHKNVKTCSFAPDLLLRESCGCTGESKIRPDYCIPFTGVNCLNGTLSQLDSDKLFSELSNYLDDNNIAHCYIVRYSKPMEFNDPAACKSVTKGSVIYGYSRGERISYARQFPFADILPGRIFNGIHGPMLLKPLYFNDLQFGFLFISVSEAAARFICDLGLELCHYLENLYLTDERAAMEKKLADAHKSLMISNRRLNQLTVKDNLDKLGNIRHLAANMLQRRKSSGNEYVLMIVEIDNFHEINSRFGFSEGEFVISNVSKILANSVRDDDFVTHQSCERYVILIRNIQNDSAQAVGKRFMHVLDELNSSIKKPYLISFTWGTALANVDTDFDLAYHQAEEALIEAKQKKCVPDKMNIK